jgi:hypothetical protein
MLGQFLFKPGSSNAYDALRRSQPFPMPGVTVSPIADRGLTESSVNRNLLKAHPTVEPAVDEAAEPEVVILAIGIKTGNRVLIGDEEHEL